MPRTELVSDKWVHVLLKGERDSQSDKIEDDYVRAFKDKSLHALRIPILEFKFKNLDELERVLVGAIHESKREGKYETGLILTSPRAVEAVWRSLEQRGIGILAEISSQLIFVVGRKTALECSQKLGVLWNYDSSESGNGVSLAGVIKSTSRSKPTRLIYPKSSLADHTIEQTVASANDIVIESIVTYETGGVTDAEDYLSDKLRAFLTPRFDGEERFNLVLNFVLFSPSGVDCFFRNNLQNISTYLIESCASITSLISKFSTIGRTTEAALKQFGVEAFCVADRPSAESLVENILVKCPALAGSGHR